VKRFSFYLFVAMSVTLSFAVDESTDLEVLRRQAEQGDSKAQLSLAFRYRDGRGVAKDEPHAMQ